MKKIIDTLAKCLEWIGGISILVMTGVVLLQVFMRRIVGQPLTWSEEFARYMFIYITFIGGGLLIHDRGHIYVEIILDRLQKKKKVWVQLFIDLIIMAFTIYLIPSALASMDAATGSFSTAMYIPMQYITLSVLLGAILMVIFGSWNIWLDIQDIKEVVKKGGDAQ